MSLMQLEQTVQAVVTIDCTVYSYSGVKEFHLRQNIRNAGSSSVFMPYMGMLYMRVADKFTAHYIHAKSV